MNNSKLSRSLKALIKANDPLWESFFLLSSSSSSLYNERNRCNKLASLNPRATSGRDFLRGHFPQLKNKVTWNEREPNNRS